MKLWKSLHSTLGLGPGNSRPGISGNFPKKSFPVRSREFFRFPGKFREIFIYYQVKNSSISLILGFFSYCLESKFAVEKDDIQDIQTENHWNSPEKCIFYQKWDVFDLLYSKFEFPGNSREIPGMFREFPFPGNWNCPGNSQPYSSWISVDTILPTQDIVFKQISLQSGTKAVHKMLSLSEIENKGLKIRRKKAPSPSLFMNQEQQKCQPDLFQLLWKCNYLVKLLKTQTLDNVQFLPNLVIPSDWY